MEVNSFVTKDFLVSFTGTLFVVELIVSITKNLPIIKKIRTKCYTFILALVHIILIGFMTNTATQTLLYYYSSFINSLIVTVMLCGGYDMIINKVNSATNIDNKEECNSSKKTTNNLVSSSNENNE